SQVGWDQVEMKLPPGGKWRKMDCYQFNSVPDPMRIMHIKFRYWGIFPFEARDKYQDGHGNLLIRLCRLVTIGDLRGKEVDASELVTLLSEALLLPAYAVQPYIRWSAIAADRVGAELSWNGTRVHGLFFFNSRGEFERFETTDRWKAAGRGRFEPMAWSVRVSDYVTRNGVRQPSRAAAAWLENGQWTDYFKGEITGTSGLAPA
ncbi:MAG TPA: DUF6544 family protein, partial [Puia sp.]|nr:DUF6544 family protein [Puia sp.]